MIVSHADEQKAGSAKTSLIGRLLDDYESAGIIDLEHENDLKLVGGGMYAGKGSSLPPNFI